jgi:two-component system, cell cycle response regulator
MPSHILIADDDATVRQSLSWVLQEQGYDVATAAGGAELWAALELRTPDLLLLDVVMPDADGCELLARMKSDTRWRDVPVLMVSSQAREDATERTLGLGAADYIKKPFKPRDLLARVQAQLRQRALLDTQRSALKAAEEELLRAREDAESRRKLVDILHEVTGDLAADEIYHILARRVARALDLSRCSVILAAPGDLTGIVATAFDNPALRNVSIDLVRYPEIRSALELGTPVLVEDLQTSPLYDDIRREWAANGTQVPIRSVIALPFSLDHQQAGVFFLRRMLEEPPLTTDDVEFADAVIKAAVAAIQRAQVIESTKTENARLEVLAHTDALTQTLNRRALTARLSSELERARRYESVLSLLMIDLDHFKDVNDTYGHLVGDDVLRETAGLLQQTIRSVDVVARYGGEEFVIVLPETPLSGAVTFAERIRVLIEKHPFRNGSEGGSLQITASVGVAVFPSEGVDTVDELLSKADEALYRAKADGRNKVTA